jgi:hypothetical protein
MRGVYDPIENLFGDEILNFLARSAMRALSGMRKATSRSGNRSASRVVQERFFAGYESLPFDDAAAASLEHSS